MLAEQFRVGTHPAHTADELAVMLRVFVDVETLDGIVLCSSVPQLIRQYELFAERWAGVELLVLGPGVSSGIPIRYDDPREVGPDRVEVEDLLPDALDHGPDPVGTLRGQMFREAELFEQRCQIALQNLFGAQARIKSQHQRHQSFDNMGIAVPAKRQNGFISALLTVGDNPDLRGTAAHTVLLVALLLRQAAQRPAEINQIAIAIFPRIQHGKSFTHIVNL